MRICSPQLGLSPKSILGGEIYDREILTAVANIGHTVDVCLPLGKPSPYIRNLNVSYLPVPFVVPPHLYNILTLPYIINTYRKYKFDILRIHSPAFIGIGAALFKKLYPHVPLVGVYHWLGEGGWLGDRLEKYLALTFDTLICDSQFTRMKLIQKYPELRDKTHTIYNGVDSHLKPITKSKQLLKKYNIKLHDVVLLYMGLFIKRKNPLFLIELVKDLRAQNLKIVLLLCGQGDLRKTMVQKIQEFGLENVVHIVSPVFGSSKNNLLNSVDIFVHPAIQEGFSLSLIEAMSVGLPVVITDDFSASEAITNGENGYLARTYSDWILYVKRLASDKNLRIRIRKNNISKVKNEFNWHHAARRHIEIFKTLV